MTTRTKVEALNLICRRKGGTGGHRRTIAALNEWSQLVGGSGGHVRGIRALNEIALRLGGTGGHGRTLTALNEIARRLGGAGGHRRNTAALDEISARLGALAPVDPEPKPDPKPEPPVDTGSDAPVPVYVFGDSNVDPLYSQGSWVYRTLALLDGRFFSPPGANFGSAGKNANWAQRQLPFLAALTAAWGKGVVWYHHGSNYSVTAASEAKAVVDAAKALGHKVVWVLPGSWASNLAELLPAAAAYAGDPAVRVVRCDLLLTDRAAQTTDGLHFTEAGDLIVRDAVLPVMTALYPRRPLSYLGVNGLTPLAMAGTGGTLTAPATGQLPTGWLGARASGDGTVAFACVTEAGRPAVEVTVTAAATATTAVLKLPSPGLALATVAGDCVDGTFSARQVSGMLDKLDLLNFPTRVGCTGDPADEVGSGDWRSAGYILPKTAAAASQNVDLEIRVQPGQRTTVRIWDVAVWKRPMPDHAPVADRGSAPTIGDPVAGKACSVTLGTWFARPAAISYAYQWQVGGVDVPGATGPSFVPTTAGASLACVVTATNAKGASAWVTQAKGVAAA